MKMLKKFYSSLSLLLFSELGSFANVSARDYDIQVKTGDRSLAGTDANIYLTIHGDEGTTAEKRLNGLISGDAFERNSLDALTLVGLEDVGTLEKVTVRSDGSFFGPDWYLDWISVDSQKATFDLWIEGADSATADFDATGSLSPSASPTESSSSNDGWEMIDLAGIWIGPGSYYTNDDEITIINESISNEQEAEEFAKQYDSTDNPIVMWQLESNNGPLWCHRAQFMFQNLDDDTGNTPKGFVTSTKNYKDIRLPQDPKDLGYTNRPRGWYDAQDRGANLDYGRYVGNPGSIYWSVALAGKTEQYTAPGEYSQPNTEALQAEHDPIPGPLPRTTRVRSDEWWSDFNPPTRPPVPAPTPSCMSGETGVMAAKARHQTALRSSQRHGSNVLKVKDLKINDVILGLDENKEPASCTVEAVGNFGFGPVYGNYTDGHFVLNPETGSVEKHGSEQAMSIQDKYIVVTSCPLGVDEAGVGFTPFDSDFFGDLTKEMSWKDYVLLHTAILRVVRETGSFWFHGSSYEDLTFLHQHAPRMSKTMLKCMKDHNDCKDLEEASVVFIERTLAEPAKKKAYEAFHNIGQHRNLGSASAAVTGGRSVRM